MKNNSFRILTGLLLSIVILTACSKSIDTNYFEDPQNSTLGIFSNKGNNIQSCIINGKAWRTVDRPGLTFGNSNQNYEVNLIKSNSGNPTDTLQIIWQGYYFNDHTATKLIKLNLAVPASFTYRDFAGFQGQRIKIDSAVNGYFETNAQGTNYNSFVKGNGNIYFNRANTDSLPQYKIGIMSGLFEADFNSFTITNGRFDHSITPQQVNF